MTDLPEEIIGALKKITELKATLERQRLAAIHAENAELVHARQKISDEIKRLRETQSSELAAPKPSLTRLDLLSTRRAKLKSDYAQLLDRTAAQKRKLKAALSSQIYIDR